MTHTDLSLAVVLADVEAAGYRIFKDATGWHLLDPDGAQLLIGDHGCAAPRKRDAIMEGARRVLVG